MTLCLPTIEVDPSELPGIAFCKGCELPFSPQSPNQIRCKPHCGIGDRHDERRERREYEFLAIDGEGGGTNEHGQQNYLLLYARGCSISRGSTSILFKDNRRLTTVECLEFILDLPSDKIIVGFFFDYDVTQILRDLPVNRLARLLSEPGHGQGLSPFTEWGEYILQYIPKQFLKVGRKGIKGSVRTINEVGGFFQSAFVKVIKQWEVCDENTIAQIQHNKDGRAEFTEITPEILDYCGMECRLLADVMTKLRARFQEGSAQVNEKLGLDLSMVPSAWRGAGYVASKILETTDTPKTKDLPDVPGEFANMMVEAYYGGHFEISRTGHINQPVWEYDINSAYPAAMPELPCPIHTEWKKIGTDPFGLFIAEVQFSHPKGNLWCGFPFRTRSGHLCWPVSGTGTYWSVEINAARKLGAEVKILKAYQAKRCCDCKPFYWVNQLYEFRKSLGKGNEGFPIKLGLNAMYGKLAQRKGARSYHNLIHAGLITAITRAKLIEAVAHDPEAVVMMATDGIYSLRELPLQIGTSLGTWECKKHPNMFIVQPGLYWFPNETDPDKSHKTRGIPKSVMQLNAPLFWESWQKFAGMGWLFPEVDVVPEKYLVPLPLNTFIGIRLALARNKPLLAGKWIITKKNISFEWSNKRGIGYWGPGKEHEYIQHFPIVGNIEDRSAPYDPSKLTELEERNVELEANPDFVQMV